MRGPIRFAQWVLLMAVALMPVLELFDCWDPPGPGSDTDIPMFTLVLAICLVVVVCRSLGLLWSALHMRELGLLVATEMGRSAAQATTRSTGVLAPLLIPLRI